MRKRTSHNPPPDVKYISSVFAYQFLRKYKLEQIAHTPKSKRSEEMKLWWSLYKHRILMFRKFESPLNDVKHRINTYMKMKNFRKFFYILNEENKETRYLKFDDYIPTPYKPHHMFIGLQSTKLICLKYNTEKDIVEFFKVPNIQGDRMLETQDELARIIKLKERNIKFYRYIRPKC